MRIRAINPDLSKSPKTYLATAIATGATSLVVKNNSPFANKDWIQLGETGAEKTEIVQVNAAVSAGTAITSTATVFAHGVDTPIYLLKYNQVRYYRSTDAGVTYSLLTTIGIQPDQLVTIYDDTTSAVTYYYKVAFFNSYTSSESDKSSALIATGFTTYALKKLQDRVLVLYPDKEERFIKREDITDWINERYLMIQQDLRELDQGYFLKDNTAAPTSLTNAISKYALPADYLGTKKIEIAFDGATYYRATPLDIRMQNNQTTWSKTEPIYDFIGNYLYFQPTPDSSSGKYKHWYFYFDELSQGTDELDLCVRPFKDVLVWHALAMACYAGGKEDRGDRFMKRADEIQARLINRMGRRQTDETQKVQLTDTGFLEVESISIPG